jgi:hypothetical protein
MGRPQSLTKPAHGHLRFSFRENNPLHLQRLVDNVQCTRRSTAPHASDAIPIPGEPQTLGSSRIPHVWRPESTLTLTWASRLATYSDHSTQQISSGPYPVTGLGTYASIVTCPLISLLRSDQVTSSYPWTLLSPPLTYLCMSSLFPFDLRHPSPNGRRPRRRRRGRRRRRRWCGWRPRRWRRRW